MNYNSFFEAILWHPYLEFLVKTIPFETWHHQDAWLILSIMRLNCANVEEEEEEDIYASSQLQSQQYSKPLIYYNKMRHFSKE
jgi:hypothetical protein